MDLLSLVSETTAGWKLDGATLYFGLYKSGLEQLHWSCSSITSIGYYYYYYIYKYI